MLLLLQCGSEDERCHVAYVVVVTLLQSHHGGDAGRFGKTWAAEEYVGGRCCRCFVAVVREMSDPVRLTGR